MPAEQSFHRRKGDAVLSGKLLLGYAGPEAGDELIGLGSWQALGAVVVRLADELTAGWHRLAAAAATGLSTHSDWNRLCIAIEEFVQDFPELSVRKVSN